MSYRVIQRSPTCIRILWRKYTKNKKTGEYLAKDRHIPISEYATLGVTTAMSFEQIKAILKKLNIEEDRRQREERRNVIALRLAMEKEIECIHLPQPFVLKFETEHLATRYLGNPNRLAKMLKLWSAGQKIIRTVTIPLDKWHRYPEHFFAYFEKHSMSPGYAKNIMSTINMWIDFLGFEQEKHYRQIPTPNSSWRSRVNTAFSEAGKAKASLPITHEMLVNAKPALTEEQANWVYCTIWAGLRPNEATALIKKSHTKIRYEGDTPILEIYQSKLKNVPNIEDRWKRIPLFLPEQLKILAMIESGKIEEPLAKTLSNRFGEGHTLYGGRKGFHDLMVTTYEQPELEVVRWLGHRSLDMAMKHYAKKDSVRWVPLKKQAS